jgi:hypothetical protein
MDFPGTMSVWWPLHACTVVGREKRSGIGTDERSTTSIESDSTTSWRSTAHESSEIVPVASLREEAAASSES